MVWAQFFLKQCPSLICVYMVPIDFFITGLCTGPYFLWDRCITALKMRCFLKLISKLMCVISKCGFDHRSGRFILHCVFLVLYILIEAEAAHGRCFYACLEKKIMWLGLRIRGSIDFKFSQQLRVTLWQLTIVQTYHNAMREHTKTSVMPQASLLKAGKIHRYFSHLQSLGRFTFSFVQQLTCPVIEMCSLAHVIYAPCPYYCSR